MLSCSFSSQRMSAHIPPETQLTSPDHVPCHPVCYQCRWEASVLGRGVELQLPWTLKRSIREHMLWNQTQLVSTKLLGLVTDLLFLSLSFITSRMGSLVSYYLMELDILEVKWLAECQAQRRSPLPVAFLGWSLPAEIRYKNECMIGIPGTALKEVSPGPHDKPGVQKVACKQGSELHEHVWKLCPMSAKCSHGRYKGL